MKIDKEAIFCITFFVIILSLIIGIIVWLIIDVINYSKTHEEWTQKVNNCVMNENYRPDCKLILYKDQQNVIERGRSTTTVMPMPVYVGR